MTIWVFGDSVSLNINDPNQWMNAVGQNLNAPVRSFGLCGSSLEFTYTTFNHARTHITNNDVVIINITEINRRWFFKNFPAHNSDTSPTNNDKETKAIETYRTYANKDIQYDYLLNFLCNVNYLTKKLDIKTVVLVNLLSEYDFIIKNQNLLKNLTIATGIIADISINEYEKDFLYNVIQKGTFGHLDMRLNHLIKSNHLILAGKIIDNIKHQITINLKTGFNEGIITKNKLEDPEFIKQELFDNWAEPFFNKNINDTSELMII